MKSYCCAPFEELALEYDPEYYFKHCQEKSCWQLHSTNRPEPVLDAVQYCPFCGEELPN